MSNIENISFNLHNFYFTDLISTFMSLSLLSLVGYSLL